jgi:hypothetical protein
LVHNYSGQVHRPENQTGRTSSAIISPGNLGGIFSCFLISEFRFHNRSNTCTNSASVL